MTTVNEKNMPTESNKPLNSHEVSKNASSKGLTGSDKLEIV